MGPRPSGYRTTFWQKAPASTSTAGVRVSAASPAAGAAHRNAARFPLRTASTATITGTAGQAVHFSTAATPTTRPARPA
ncbi:hypothetical protein AVW11_30275 [Streptomyces amritsarensis]|uniref:Uncharacterized protein n=1 Tax=Streptomyces amritsarensis TaxID=681158 RepID=A0ABX3FWQ2_9ACTN|nr:hypothetical protein AVW11_30275 [Streptomyces amritsarensis]